jgi:tetratricopeptide (TPR) repeat protein
MGMYSWAEDKDSDVNIPSVSVLDKARALYEIGDYNAAIQEYEGILKQAPENALALAEKALCLNTLHLHNDALLSSEKALQIDANCILAHAARGDALTFLGRNYEAIKAYSAGENIIPRDDIGFLHRGALQLAMKSLEDAIDDINKAIELNPKRSQSYYTRAQAYAATESLEKAMEDYTRSISLNPKSAQAYVSRGNIYAKLGNNEKALADWSKAIDINPNFALAFFNRGTFYGVYKQDFNREVTDCKRAIELDPQYADAYYNRGHAYKGLGQYEKALADFTKVIELDPTRAVAYQSRGVTYGKKGDYAAAKKDWQKAVELDPNGDTGKRAKSNLQALKNAGY